MNKKIDRLIPFAFEAVSTSPVVQEGEISKQYNGYISSFGAAVIQSGLLAALVFNHREKTRSEQDRKALMDVIYKVVKKIRNDESTNGKDNLLTYTENATDRSRLKNQIMDAATAIKLVIRTFKLTDNPADHE